MGPKEHLYLENINLTDEGCQVLVDHILQTQDNNGNINGNCIRLKDLWLVNNFISNNNNSLETIIRNVPTLEYLGLYRNPIEDSSLLQLEELCVKHHVKLYHDKMKV